MKIYRMGYIYICIQYIYIYIPSIFIEWDIPSQQLMMVVLVFLVVAQARPTG